VDDLAQRRHAELRHHASALGEVGEHLHRREGLAQRSLADLGRASLDIPAPHVLEIDDP